MHNTLQRNSEENCNWLVLVALTLFYSLTNCFSVAISIVILGKTRRREFTTNSAFLPRQTSEFLVFAEKNLKL